MRIRPIDELASPENPAWPQIRHLVETASVPSRAREVDPSRAREVLHRLQVTAGSFLGAMALHSGGIIADHGWFRLYGGARRDAGRFIQLPALVGMGA